MTHKSTGSIRRLGVINWTVCRIAARVLQVPEVHLFTTLGQHKRLLWTWLPFAGVLLGAGSLPKQYTELVILRVGHLRGCDYELQQHGRIAKKRGVTEHVQAQIRIGPTGNDLTYYQRALLTAVDEFVESRTLSRDTRNWLYNFLSERQLIELCTLIGQYDALAATIAALRIPLDYPE
jgi:AhpD family alkylhydroperoxidase